MLGKLYVLLCWIFGDYVDIFRCNMECYYFSHCQDTLSFSLPNTFHLCFLIANIFDDIYFAYILFILYLLFHFTNEYNPKFTWYPLANHSIAVSTSFYLLINPIAFIQLVTHMEGYFFFFKSKVQCSVKPTIRNVTRFYLFYNGIIKPW